MNKDKINKFIKYSLIRAIKTFCQTLLSMVPVAVMISEVEWFNVLSTALLAAILSVCTSVITGLPEVEMEGVPNDEPRDD